MAAVHNEDIRDLLSSIPIIPDNLMIQYLMRRFNMSENRARETIYQACRQYRHMKPVCYSLKGSITRSENVTMNSNLLSLCKALRVACEYLPGSRQFVVSKVFPWILTFYDNGYVYHVCEFNRGEELLKAEVIRSAGIAREMLPVTTRICILGPGTNQNLIQACGMRYFCTVDTNTWDLDVLSAVPDEEVWKGMPVYDCHAIS